MSMPKEILESMLSAYMDDALSTDQRNRVEQMLRSDPAVARELEEMKELRLALRRIRDLDSNVTLGDHFAQSVIEATVARGRAEGLQDDHHVIRLAEQPSPIHSSDRGSAIRIAKIVAALAASIVLVFLVTRSFDNGSTVSLVAPTDSSSNEAFSDLPESERFRVRPVPTPNSGDIVSLESEKNVADQADSGGIASNAESNALPDLDSGNRATSMQSADRVASADRTSSADRASSAAAEPGVPIEMSSVPTSDVAIADGASSRPSAEAKIAPINVILVLDVRCSMFGRTSNAVQSALESAGIDSANRKRVNDDLVSFAVSSERASEPDKAQTASAQSTTVLYMEAAATKLDQFILNLIADEEGIESVRMSIAADPPLVGLVRSFQPVDPTTVQHSAAWQLDANDDTTISALAGHLSDRQYANVTSERGAMGLAATQLQSASSTADVISQVLVLVR